MDLYLQNDRKLFSKRDFVLAAALVFIALAAMLTINFISPQADFAEIKADGEIIMQIPLNEDKEFKIPDYEKIIFKIHNNSICIKSSDCPDKLCVNSGYINKSGQIIVCLPNKISVQVISAGGSSGSDYTDAVTG